MTTAFFPIGLPGSGKSTFVDAWISGGVLAPDAIVSTDWIRQELYGHFAEQGDPERVFGLAYERLYQRLKAGRDVYFDATNLTSKTRRQLIRTAHRTNSDIVWIHFDVPASICRERNASRPHPVPDEVMDRMEAQLASIDWAEMPGVIIRVDESGKIS